ncbi:uncharacterized protein LOC103061574, partial [Python bivittatus]|uniref:Uncharacterized protein LOC103061574 n=1 Tax=Python bivittatus TaxID=176946 RepID=A0A9F2RFV4_PYTBI
LHVVRVFVPYIQMRMRDEIATLTVKTRLHLSAKFFFGKHSERIDIITDVSVKTELSFGSFWLGVVDVSFRSCHAEFKVARIISSSRLQTIKAKPIVKTVLTASLPRLLCEALQQAIGIVRVDFLSTVDVFLHVGPVASIQSQLASRPVISSAYYVFELNMILRTKNHFFIVPFSKSPIPLPSLQDNAFSLGITQDNLNVILGVLIQIPVQEFSGTPEVFSGATELTAVIAGLFSHQKCHKCPIQPPLKIAITLVGSKKIILEPSLIIIHLSVEISFSVTSPSGALNGLFVLRANLALSTQADVHDNKLQFSSKVTSMELILVSSEFGTIE